jgi:3-dehydroquinate synthase
VASLYADAVLSELQPAKVSFFSVKAGESFKTLQTVETMYSAFVKFGLDRKSVVLALGGGVVGDMAGFAASTYMRGIQFAQAPTTLLSQVDASVGGKLGVDFMGAKNLIGVFCQPAFVYINTSTLRTLPPEQFSSGMAEVIKHGLALDADYLNSLKAAKEKIKAMEPQALKEAIEGSCRIKSNIVAQDERETGIRELLNFGHTSGHAVESLSGFALPHGHAVAIGMVAAMSLSASRGLIAESEIEDACQLLSYFGLPLKADASPDKVFEMMRLDKKSKGGEIHAVLLEKIGKAFTCVPSKDELFLAIGRICG